MSVCNAAANLEHFIVCIGAAYFGDIHTHCGDLNIILLEKGNASMKKFSSNSHQTKLVDLKKLIFQINGNNQKCYVNSVCFASDHII